MIPLETQSQRFSGQPAGGAALQNAPFAAAAPAEQSAGAAAWGEAAQHLDPSFQDSLKEPLLDASLADIGSAQKSMQLSGFALVSLNGDYSYHIPIDSKETVIGRAAEAKEFLRNKPFVSRRHCKVRIIGQKAYLEDINETNHTYVNNAAVKEGYMAELSDGDEIGLGGKIIGGARQEEAAFFVFHYA
jgi:pSer/pThr/pTyr-binding forkhead associated (FHA) protein